MTTVPSEQAVLTALTIQREGFDAVIEATIQTFKPLSPSLEEFWIDNPTPSDWNSRTKIIRPKDATSTPLIVMFFGGAFQVGNPAQVTRPARESAEKFGACVACPSYRFLLENRRPIPMQHGYEAVRYLSSNAEKELGVDLSAGFVVGSISAGATPAAIVAGFNASHPSRELGGQVPNLVKPLTGVYLSVPLLFTENIVPKEYKELGTSLDDNKDVEPLTAEKVKMIVDMIAPDTKSPWFSPLHALAPSNHSWPPTYFQACGLDTFRDDAVVFEKMLSSRGTKTKIDMFPKDVHGAWFAQPYHCQSIEPTMEEGTMGGIEWLLIT